MYYSNYKGAEDVYETDEDGNIKYIEIDGEQIPVKAGVKKASYTEPTLFYSSIQSQLSELRIKSWGIDQSALYSEIVVSKGYLPKDFGVGSIIWLQSEIAYEDDGTPKQSSSDFTVMGIDLEGLTEDLYLLQRNSSESENNG